MSSKRTNTEQEVNPNLPAKFRLPEFPPGCILAFMTPTETGIVLDRAIGTDPVTGLKFDININPERTLLRRPPAEATGEISHEFYQEGDGTTPRKL